MYKVNNNNNNHSNTENENDDKTTKAIKEINDFVFFIRVKTKPIYSKFK